MDKYGTSFGEVVIGHSKIACVFFLVGPTTCCEYSKKKSSLFPKEALRSLWSEASFFEFVENAVNISHMCFHIVWEDDTVIYVVVHTVLAFF